MKRLLVLLCCLLLLTGTISAHGRELPYTDANEIRNTDAVFMLTDLYMLQGDDNQAFRPNDILTRAEVVKLAALVLTDQPAADQPAPFYDLDHCWARDYIDFCYAQGILSYSPDGNFRPDDPVTAQELVKIMLGAIGYDLSAMVGDDWAVRLDELANELHVYNGYDLDPSRPLTRDYAARLILNILNCYAVEGYENGEPIYVVDDLLNPVTVLESRFGVIRYQQVITANEYADLGNPDAPLEEGDTKLYGHYSMGFSTGLGDLGRTVTVYLRDGMVVGVPVFDPAEFCVTVQGAESLALLFTSGGYAMAENAPVYVDGVAADATALDALADNASVTLIDYESDGLIDLALVYHWTACPVLQNDPLVISANGETEVFLGLTTPQNATEVSALCIHGKWVVKTF